jgi:hypothetical protein
VDWTGRIIREDKRGSINAALPPIFQTLDISLEQWLINTTQFVLIHQHRFNRIEPMLDTG